MLNFKKPVNSKLSMIIIDKSQALVSAIKTNLEKPVHVS